MIVIAALFALTWLREITASVVSGKLPAALAAAGWPMNPVYVLDLGFVIPLVVLGGLRLLRDKPGGVRLAVPFLVFLPLLSISVLLMTVFMAIDGQPLAMPLIAIFGVALAVSAALAWIALRTRRQVLAFVREADSFS
jgi:FtsH-binding integral membrane protein